MEQTQSSAMSSDNSSKVPTQTRRYWNKVEEDALVDALEALCLEGWNDNGSYRGGYLPKLERMLITSLPNKGIRHRHIKSKLQGWKKTYQLLNGVVGKSGGRGATLDPQTYILNVQDEELWKQQVVENPDLAKLRDKVHPYYYRWMKIWGADHAVGDGACDIGDAMNQLFSKEKRKDTGMHEKDGDTFNIVDIEDDATSKPAAPSTSGIKKPRQSVKRSRNENDEGEYDSLVTAWVQGSSAVLETFAEKIAQIFPKQDTPATAQTESCSGIFENITSVSNLTLDQQLRCLHHLTQNKLEIEVFAEMNEGARERYLHMLLDGSLRI